MLAFVYISSIHSSSFGLLHFKAIALSFFASLREPKEVLAYVTTFRNEIPRTSWSYYVLINQSFTKQEILKYLKFANFLHQATFHLLLNHSTELFPFCFPIVIPKALTEFALKVVFTAVAVNINTLSCFYLCSIHGLLLLFHCDFVVLLYLMLCHVLNQNVHLNGFYRDCCPMPAFYFKNRRGNMGD